MKNIDCPPRTAVHHIVVVQIVDGVEDLANGLGGILLRELPLLADTIKQLSARSQLRDDVVLVLSPVSLVGQSTRQCASLTLDSNQSWNLTMCGCFRRCSISSSSYTICSLPRTFFLRIILTATFPSGQSASRTMPYVPAPSVLPKR